MPPTEQVDGRFYTSKAAFRATGRALGLTEVGNERSRRRVAIDRHQGGQGRAPAGAQEGNGEVKAGHVR